MIRTEIENGREAFDVNSVRAPRTPYDDFPASSGGLWRLAVILVATASLSMTGTAADGDAYLVKDIDSQVLVASSHPYGFARLGSQVLFVAETPSKGHALWRIDVDEGAAVLVTEIEAGPLGDDIRHLTTLGEIVVFTRTPIDAGDPPTFFELWRTDGTAAGTRFLRSIPGAGTDVFYGNALARIDQHLLFIAYDIRAQTVTLWRSDGTGSGTVPIKEFTDEDVDFPYDPNLTAAGDLAFFEGSAPATGREPWVTDGTPAGTRLLRDTVPGPPSADAAEFVVTLDGIFFTMVEYDTSKWRGLWKTDGTPDGTVLLRDDIGAWDLTDFNGILYFLTGIPPDGPALWRSDGTAAGTRPVTPLARPLELTAGIGRLFIHGFVLSESGETLGTGLWTSDGTSAGTVPITDGLASYSTGLTPADDLVFFAAAAASTEDLELWVTDGTREQTARVRDVNRGPLGSGPSPLGVTGNTLWFAATDAARGRELWRSDGTEQGTGIAANIALDDLLTESSYPRDLTPFGARVFFQARDAVWVSDGSSGGTVQLADFSSLFRPSISNLAVFQGRVYFGAASGLWVTDGTPSGTTPLPEEGGVSALTPVGDLLFFRQETGYRQESLCRIDGSGRRLCLPPPGSGGFVQWLTAATDRIFFVTAESGVGAELWVSDGTAQGAHRVRDINPGPNGSSPWYLTAVGRDVYFVAGDGAHGRELWKSDGTDTGTVRITDLVTLASDREIGGLTAVGHLVFFGLGGAELWVSDGTPGDARHLATFCERCDIPSFDLVGLGERLLIAADDGVHGRELWISDGTETGTRLLADINPGPAGSNLELLTAVDGYVAFRACDAHGCEPWVSDGTTAGTRRVADVAPGAAGSEPGHFAVADSRLFFAASDHIHGTELWAARLATESSCVGDCDGDGRVSISDLITAVNLALLQAPLEACTAADSDDDRAVSIAELVTAVNAALSECSSP